MKNCLTSLVIFFSFCMYAQNIAVTLLKDGFGSITDIAQPPGDNRLFIAEQWGRIRILNPNQTVNATSFLSLPSTVTQQGIENGLLGLAFHPNYTTNRFFYIHYNNLAGDGVIARYVGGTNTANPTATIVMTIPQTASQIHKGGSLQFGPDGLLYISVGDNGDTANAQNINSYMGKILRIDVNSSTSQTPNYAVPASNPYVGADGHDEIWAIGLRNPWHMSIDANNQLWIADVGQNIQEEINKVNASTPGLNYGWNCYEGNATYATTCPIAVSAVTFPIVSYENPADWCAAVIGGYVYSGSIHPSFSGKYFFGDGCSNRIGWIDPDNSLHWSEPIANFEGPNTFGKGNNGELYVGSSGGVYRLTDPGLATQSFKKINLELHPNPATAEFFVKTDALYFPATARVFDSSGKLLCHQSLDSKATAIATHQLESGIYMVALVDATGATANAKLLIR